MKNRVRIMYYGIVFIMACQSKTSGVQGTYVNHAQSASAVADDTLTFARTVGQHYLITRHTVYAAVREGRLLAKKLKREQAEGEYDSRLSVLKETTAGRLYRFDADKGLLLVKQAAYRKLR